MGLKVVGASMTEKSEKDKKYEWKQAWWRFCVGMGYTNALEMEIHETKSKLEHLTEQLAEWKAMDYSEKLRLLKLEALDGKELGKE